jgi:low temperature requirement protein LtrA
MDDPGRMARLAYTYIHLPIIAGIVITAVGDEIVLAHPRGDSELSGALAIAGGPAVFLTGYILFKRAIAGRSFAAHFIALGLIVVTGLAHPILSPVELSIASSAILGGVAVWGRLVHVEPAPEEPALNLAAEPATPGG